MKFTVTFHEQSGDIKYRVNIRPDSVVAWEVDDGGRYPLCTAEEYYGGHHNYDGLRGAAVDRAVRKTYGPRAFWFGECDCLRRGQVFEALRPTRRNSNPGNSSLTPTITIGVDEGWN